jgi:DNA polymerase-1
LQENGFVQTIVGRRYLKTLTHKMLLFVVVQRNAVNAPIQGSAADIIKVR